MAATPRRKSSRCMPVVVYPRTRAFPASAVRFCTHAGLARSPLHVHPAAWSSWASSDEGNSCRRGAEWSCCPGVWAYQTQQLPSDKRGVVLQGFSQLEAKELAPCDVYSLGASVLELAYGRALSCSDAEYAKVREGSPVELAGEPVCPVRTEAVLAVACAWACLHVRSHTNCRVEHPDTSPQGKALARILTEMLQPSADVRIDCAQVFPPSVRSLRSCIIAFRSALLQSPL